MTLYAYGTSVTLDSTQVLGQNDVAIVGPGVTVQHVSNPLSVTAFGTSVLVQGALAGGNEALQWGSEGIFNASSSVVSITSTGSITGFIGIVSYAYDSTIFNAGTILGVREAIGHSATQFGALTINNSGLIASSASYGIIRLTAATTDLIVNNSGTIAGGNGFAAFGSNNTVSGVDKITNSGTFMGDVELGGGNDIYDARGNGLVEGIINGEDGTDTFLPGLAIETIYGGAGIDTVDLRRGAGVTVALDGSRNNTGFAKDDSYFQIETVVGSRLGADVLIGDVLANRLFGLGGADNLSGGAGADSLDGGDGVDRLTGGLGNDSFTFRSKAGAGDLILDFFSNSAGNNDAVAVSRVAFGGGMAAGVLPNAQFQLRADNVAQDSNDRFIFRTSDKTLWFDVDGTGAAAAIMLADLQASATMSAADILII